jgi:hypothetical protein
LAIALAGNRRSNLCIVGAALPRGVHRGIQQHGVFANELAARPVHFHEQSHERLCDRFGRTQLDDVPTVSRVHRLHGDTAHECRPIQFVAGERLARCDLRFQPPELIRRSADELDFRIERSVEGRQETDVPEPEAECGWRNEQ